MVEPAAVLAARREGGGVEYDVETPGVQDLPQWRLRGRVLEAGQRHARDIRAARVQRLGQRVDGRDVAGHQDRAVEHDQRARRVMRLRQASAFVARKRRYGPRRRGRAALPQRVSDMAQARREILRAAGLEIGP